MRAMLPIDQSQLEAGGRQTYSKRCGIDPEGMF
jgi:hypothetical protein